MNRTTRGIAWAVILGIAAFQAYAQRYVVGPDGISYLDLSDAVAGGHWGGLVNLYWSPLFPLLIGIARAIAGSSPAREVPIIHAVQFLSFAAMFAAFEYFLFQVLELARRTPRSALAMKWGPAAAYALFGFFGLTMTPLELTTPDLLSSAAALLAFGALLRLHDDTPHGKRDAVILGAALGAGALAKAFMVPWAIVCLATLAIALRRRGLARAGLAALVWLAFVVPLATTMSRAASHFTFGETGRLTYAWYVNGDFAPSLGGVPPGARSSVTDAILPGTGVTGDAPGTNPMWFDPARWNANLHPHWDLKNQLLTLTTFQLFYVQNFTVLVFLVLLIVIAPRGSRRNAWYRGWVVYLPAFAGCMGYAMVIVAARYVMPFVLAPTLVLLATLPVARRMTPLLTFLGLMIPVLLESIDVRTDTGLALVSATLGGMLAGVLVPARRRAVWVVVVIVAMLATHVLLVPVLSRLLPIGAVAIATVFWIASRAAIREGRPVSFAQRALGALLLLVSISLATRFTNRFMADLNASASAAAPNRGNVSVAIARELATHGVGPGTRVAVIGPHAEAYWARAGRLKIVANVPRPIVPRFWALAPAMRDSLLATFASAGATFAIASISPEDQTPDSTWTPIKFHGWLRPLGPQPKR